VVNALVRGIVEPMGTIGRRIARPSQGDVELLTRMVDTARAGLDAAVSDAGRGWSERVGPIEDEVRRRRLDNLAYQVMLRRRWRRWARRSRRELAG
jgi:hypothetical protein